MKKKKKEKPKKIQIVKKLKDGLNSITWTNGDGYTGKINEHNEPEGKGVYIFNNGDKYEGYFRKGKKYGRGILHHNNGKASKCLYVGGIEWSRD